MREFEYYVLFPNHDNAMRLYQALSSIHIKSKIAPTPRSVSKCCGVSLMVEPDDLEQIKKVIEEKRVVIEEIARVKTDIDPRRDKYC